MNEDPVTMHVTLKRPVRVTVNGRSVRVIAFNADLGDPHETPTSMPAMGQYNATALVLHPDDGDPRVFVTWRGILEAPDDIIDGLTYPDDTKES